MMSDMSQWAAGPASWITGEGESHGHTVISSRIRIARNLFTAPFPHNASSQVQKQVLNQLFDIFKTATVLKNSSSFRINDFDQLERAFLVERQLISREHANKDGERGLVVTSGESMSIMINEEDHIRAASFHPGLGLGEAWETLVKLDNETADQCSLAFDPTFGFVTSCPTNTGTGLRASCLLHLPALSLTGKIADVIQKLESMGISTRGFYGEGTRSLGDLFQVSNAVTLGQTEETLIKTVERIVRNICDLEKREEEILLKIPMRNQAEDRIYRSLGVLQSARSLEFEECMHHLSLVRLGKKNNLDIQLGMKKLTNLFFMAQPAHIWIRKGGESLPSASESALRAQYLRSQF